MFEAKSESHAKSILAELSAVTPLSPNHVTPPALETPVAMPTPAPPPNAKHTLEELWNEAQHLLDVVVPNALRPWNKHQNADDVQWFKQRLSEKLLKDDKKLLRNFRQEAELKTWLQKIANREVNRALLKESRSVSFDDAPPQVFEQKPRQEELLLRKEQTQLLAEAIAKLTPRERKLAELLQQDLKAEEIARELGIKVNSVHRIKNTVVKKLGKLVNGEGAKIVF